MWFPECATHGVVRHVGRAFWSLEDGTMPIKAKELTAIQVKQVNKPGRYAVGTVSGLYLMVRDKSLTKSWVLRVVVKGKRKDIGLGAYPEVTLAAAVADARVKKSEIQAGFDPVAKRKAEKVAEMTFEDCSAKFIELHRTGWRNAKHAQQWQNTLKTYVYPFIGSMRVKDIQTEHVLPLLEMHWTNKNETMVRVRNRIQQILDWAMVKGYREVGLNPAMWRGHLDKALPKPSKVNNRKHHPALPWVELPNFMKSLQQQPGIAAKCLAFAVLTACRSGEARGAKWSEIDLDSKVWTIPGDRTKSGRLHRIPLSDFAMMVLYSLPRQHGLDLVFIGRNQRACLSDMSLTAVLRRMGVKAVPHGFRSTFRDWAAEATAYSNEVCEMALAHAVTSDVESAYRRGDLLNKRAMLMSDWGAYAMSEIQKTSV
jgi:integrase